MGQLLSEVKERLPHGDFGQWIDVEFGLSDRHARRFMGVYDHFKSDIMSDLPATPTILFALSAPSVDEETREAAVAEIQAGNIRTVALAPDKQAVAGKAEQVHD